MKEYDTQFESIVFPQYQGILVLFVVCLCLSGVTLALWGQHRVAGAVTALLALAAFVGALLGLRRLRKHYIHPAGQILEELSDSSVLHKHVGDSLHLDSPLLGVAARINQSLDNTGHLVQLIENVNSHDTFDSLLRYIYTTYSPFIPYSHIGIALLQEDGKTIEASYGISGGPLEGLARKLVGLTAQLENTSMGPILHQGEPRIISNLEQYTKNPNSNYNRILLEAGVKSSITLPLRIEGRPVGIIFFSSAVAGIYRQEHLTTLQILANSIATSLNKNIFIDRLLYSSVLGLAKLAESRDGDTGDHLGRMKQYSRLIAQLLMEDEVYPEATYELVRGVERFSPMHDIGKVGVPDHVLKKPGKLTAEEFEEMKLHPIYGADVLRAAQAGVAAHHPRLFATGIEIAESHHERWDGSGYPYGLQGDQIPLSARVVAVADVFDALTSKRVYKEAYSFEEAFNMLLEGGGSHFDPAIIDCLAKHKDQFHSLYVSLNRHT